MSNEELLKFGEKGGEQEFTFWGGDKAIALIKKQYPQMNNRLEEMLSSANTHLSRVAAAKEKSPIYPDVLFDTIGAICFITTMVRICRDGIWYKIHHYDEINITYFKSDDDLVQSKTEMWKLLIVDAYKTQLFYKITDIKDGDGKLLYDIDTNQQSEQERLIEKYKK